MCIKPFKFVLFVSCLVLFLSSCITASKVNYLQETKNYIPSYRDTVSYSEYLIKPGDRLFVKVYSPDNKTNTLFNGEGNMISNVLNNSGGSSSNTELFTYLVQDNGTVQLPMAGDVKVSGYSVRQARDMIETSLKPFFKFSTVSVILTGRSFSIISNNKAGKYSITHEKVNIFEALAMAGNLDEFGDRRKIRVIRQTVTGPVVKVFDLRSKDIIHSEYYYIQPNDVIYIQNMKEEIYGMTSFASMLSFVMTTLSFAIYIYKLM